MKITMRMYKTVFFKDMAGQLLPFPGVALPFLDQVFFYPSSKGLSKMSIFSTAFNAFLGEKHTLFSGSMYPAKGQVVDRQGTLDVHPFPEERVDDKSLPFLIKTKVVASK